jgi:hypothetical protein
MKYHLRVNEEEVSKEKCSEIFEFCRRKDLGGLELELEDEQLFLLKEGVKKIFDDKPSIRRLIRRKDGTLVGYFTAVTKIDGKEAFDFQTKGEVKNIHDSFEVDFFEEEGPADRIRLEEAIKDERFIQYEFFFEHDRKTDWGIIIDELTGLVNFLEKEKENGESFYIDEPVVFRKNSEAEWKEKFDCCAIFYYEGWLYLYVLDNPPIRVDPHRIIL